MTSSPSAPEIINEILHTICIDKKPVPPERYRVLMDAIRTHRVMLQAPKSKAAPKTTKAVLAQTTLENLLNMEFDT